MSEQESGLKLAQEPATEELTALQVAEQIFEKAENDYARLIEDFNNEYFEVEGNKAYATKLLTFLTEEANWKFTEAYYVIDMQKRLNEQINNFGEKLKLKSMDVDAFHYFFNKKEGKGIQEAQEFWSLAKPVLDVMEKTQRVKDTFKVKEEQLQELAWKVSEAKTGLQTETLD
jgi:hypothetical protein